MRDDQHATLVVLDGQHQGSKAVAVQVVCGLVEDEDVRVLPHGGGQDDLDLHATAELVDLGVGGGLGVHTEVAEMLLHGGLGELLGHEPGHGRLPLVLALHDLQVAHLHEDVLLHPRGLVHGLELPLHLVLIGLLLLLLAPVHARVGDHRARLVDLGLLGVLLGVSAPPDVARGRIDAPLRRPGLLLVHRQLGALELQALLVVVARETPHDVLRGRFLHVLLQMVERVLSDVGHAQARGLPDGALRGLLLADKDLDGGGLARAVGTDHGHAADLRDGQADVHDGGLVLGGVLEGDLVHPQDHLASALHALHGPGLREDELHDLVAELEVGLFLRVFLDELRQGPALLALERLQLAVLEIDDVGAHLVEEWGEVRRADDAACEGLQPILQPLDVVHVQMPSGLVKHKHVRVHQLRCAELHLHLPSARVGSDGVVKVGSAVWAARVAEASDFHDLLRRLLSHGVRHLVDVVARVHDPPPARLVHTQNREAVVLYSHLLILDLVLHENGFKFIALGEAFELFVGDGTHESRLAALIGAEKPIETIALQVHFSIAQQGQSTVCKGEGALVQIHALCVLLLDLLRGLGCELHLCADLVDRVAVGSTDGDALLPVRWVVRAHVGGGGSQGSDVRQGQPGLVVNLATQAGLEQCRGALHRRLLELCAGRGLGHSAVRPLGHRTGLGV
mmetsp:Transcript_103480/g.292964  ORF Transcript_103480/g.292964 Transcript_103480/m.292964 type:complete len:680 (-) Transcript_103480:860-2899(-)